MDPKKESLMAYISRSCDLPKKGFWADVIVDPQMGHRVPKRKFLMADGGRLGPTDEVGSPGKEI